MQCRDRSAEGTVIFSKDHNRQAYKYLRAVVKVTAVVIIVDWAITDDIGSLANKTDETLGTTRRKGRYWIPSPVTEFTQFATEDWQ